MNQNDLAKQVRENAARLAELRKRKSNLEQLFKRNKKVSLLTEIYDLDLQISDAQAAYENAFNQSRQVV